MPAVCKKQGGSGEVFRRALPDDNRAEKIKGEILAQDREKKRCGIFQSWESDCGLQRVERCGTAYWMQGGTNLEMLSGGNPMYLWQGIPLYDWRAREKNRKICTAAKQVAVIFFREIKKIKINR